jgi:hypothetical protein
MTQITGRSRQVVIQRAGNCCEYCLLSQTDSFLPFEVDHIIAEKHRGISTDDNLAFSCPDCNGFKGSDVASYDPVTGSLTALFNPRTQEWSAHFQLDGAIIKPRTPGGRVTEFLLQLNSDERVAHREVLLAINRYPCR